jgi:hypothetical protein
MRSWHRLCVLLSFPAALACSASPVGNVRGTGQVTWVYATGRASEPIDFTKTPPEALVDDGKGGFTVYPSLPGTGALAGTFDIPGVPLGTYTLHFGDRWLVTDSHVPDLGYTRSGRPASQRSVLTQFTPFALHLDGLAPWTPTSTLEMFSPQADDWDFGSERFATTSTLAGATSVDLAVSLDAFVVAPASALQAAKGDRLVITQLAPRTSSTGVEYQALVGLAAPDAFDAPGAASVSATLSPVPDAPAPLSVDYRGTQWSAAAAADGNPAQTTACGVYGGFAVEASAGTARDGIPSATADLLLFNTPAGTNPDVQTGLMPWPGANALPGAWSVWVDMRQSTQVPLRLPGTTMYGWSSCGGVPSGLSWTTTVDRAQAGPFVPVLSLPRAPTLDGKPAFADNRGVGTTPLLAWTPPATGAPDFYLVEVSSLAVKTLAGQPSTYPTLVARLATAAPHLRLPPGVLAAGRSYAITIQAVQYTGTAANVISASAPWKLPGDLATAQTVLGIVAP